MAGTDQRSGDHFVEHPNEVKIEQDDGRTYTFCWLEHERACTGGCQAFDPKYADDETARYTSCRILNLGIVCASAVSHFVSKYDPHKSDHSIDIPGINLKPPEAT